MVASGLEEEGRELGQHRGLWGFVVTKLKLDLLGLNASKHLLKTNAELARGQEIWQPLQKRYQGLLERS